MEMRSIAFLRSTPKFVNQIGTIKLEGEQDGSIKTAAIRRVFRLTEEIAETDGESAARGVSFVDGRASQSVARAVRGMDRNGPSEMDGESTKAAAKLLRARNAPVERAAHADTGRLAARKVQPSCGSISKGLTGKEVEIAPLSAMPQESRIGDGKTIYLPATVAEFDTDEMDFRLLQGARGARCGADRVRDF